MDLSSSLAVTGWFVQVIFDKCLSSALEFLVTFGSHPDLPLALQRLQHALRNARALIPLVQRVRGENKSLLEWLNDLKVAAYDADDLFGELDYRRLQQQVESSSSSSKVSDILSHHFSSAVALVAGSLTNNNQAETGTSSPRYVLAGVDEATVDRINEIVGRLDRITTGLKSILTLLKLEEINPNVPEFSGSDRVTTSLQSEHTVFGREAEKDQIVDLLLSDWRPTRRPSDVSVLPIVGMGGIGKTTFARLVYNDERVARHFQLKMWVCVSDSFDVAKLTLEMLECSGVADARPSDRVTNLNRLQLALREKLSSMRFLLVLDDVWNDTEKKKWETFCAPLQSGKPGSRILMTTRLNSVASMVSKTMDTLDPIELKGFPEETYWPFFIECAFGSQDPGDYPKLARIGRQIADKLKGSPLAAKTVGGLLRERLDDEYWRSILQSDIWELPQGPDDIMPALRLSYQHLPVHLQQCFAYCSVFPKNYLFYPDRLVAMWMAGIFRSS